MYKNIGDKIKNIALILVFISLAGGGVWLFISITQYAEYSEFLEYEGLSQYYYISLKAKNGITYSIITIISGIVSSYFIYGFGQLIEHVKNIDYKLNGIPKENEDDEKKISDEEIIKELEQDSSYKN